jgi:hypothetical protein|tara:strand:- start:434 stop:679 length:246 start_codon:yes stop_codon:yes gene_type:complete
MALLQRRAAPCRAVPHSRTVKNLKENNIIVKPMRFSSLAHSNERQSRDSLSNPTFSCFTAFLPYTKGLQNLLVIGVTPRYL